MTVPAASNFYLVSWQPGVSERAYASRGEMLADVTSILRAEVEALVAEGVAYVQLDAPYYGWLLDEAARERLRADGIDPDRALIGVDAFLLEYDSPRAGTFEPLRHVPASATVVLGLVTTKEPRLESIDDLLRRIDDASRFLPLDRLALSPQCGFASVAAGNLLGEDDEWRKLELVVETARRVWG